MVLNPRSYSHYSISLGRCVLAARANGMQTYERVDVLFHVTTSLMILIVFGVKKKIIIIIIIHNTRVLCSRCRVTTIEIRHEGAFASAATFCSPDYSCGDKPSKSSTPVQRQLRTRASLFRLIANFEKTKNHASGGLDYYVIIIIYNIVNNLQIACTRNISLYYFFETQDELRIRVIKLYRICRW